MIRSKTFWGIIIALVIVGISTGFYWYHQQSENVMTEQMREPAFDLGVVYLPLNQNLAKYYKLDINSGALVTEVFKGSLVDQAGIKAGEVILAFNGIKVDEAAPLLGMIRSCPMGQAISLVVWSDGNTREVTIVHPGK